MSERVYDGREFAPPVERLLDVDEKSAELLKSEILEASEASINVTVGERKDSAYENIGEVYRVFDELSRADDAVEHQRKVELGGLARRAQYMTSPDFLRQSWAAHVNGGSAVEQARIDYLYGAEHTDAEAWWRQGGSALALATIVHAYDLTADEDGDGYPTMSGPIDEGILTHVFDDTILELSGNRLESAVAIMSQQYGLLRGLRALSLEEQEQRAVEKMTRLEDFVTAPNTKEFLDVIRYCHDGIGIRERMTAVNDRIVEHLSDKYSPQSPVIVSLGCGTAIPTLDLLARLREQGKSPHLVAFDQDPIALAVAQRSAERLGLSDAVELHCEQLFSKTGKPVDLRKHLCGRMPSVVENSGLREYVPDVAYGRLLKAIRNVLAPGGLAVNCSTNENRPHKGFLYGAMGWPVQIRRCEIQKMTSDIEKSGFDARYTEAHVVPSGVYTCYFSQKP